MFSTILVISVFFLLLFFCKLCYCPFRGTPLRTALYGISDEGGVLRKTVWYKVSQKTDDHKIWNMSCFILGLKSTLASNQLHRKVSESPRCSDFPNTTHTLCIPRVGIDGAKSATCIGQNSDCILTRDSISLVPYFYWSLLCLHGSEVCQLLILHQYCLWNQRRN